MRAGPTRKQRREGAPTPTATAAAPQGLRLHRRGRQAGVVALEQEVAYSIGRAPHVELRFDDENVSRLHAHLKFADGAWRLIDAGSQNGTFLCRGGAPSRERLFESPRLLQPGERVEIGVSDVVFFGDEHAALEAVARVETLLQRAVDGTHAALADGIDDGVAAVEHGAWSERRHAAMLADSLSGQPQQTSNRRAVVRWEGST
jgi:pSer/pThr/pTyr-binding forkhead associated (FHA) protein